MYKLKETWYSLPPWTLRGWCSHHALLSSSVGARALQAPCWKFRSRRARALGRQGDIAEQ